jgi:signal transduction histidine kinase
MEDQTPFESELISRIGWLIRLRWIAVAGTAVSIAVAALRFRGALQVGALLAVTLVIAVYNLLFWLNLRSVRLGPSGYARLRHATVLASAQIVLDLVALATLIHFSGGVENPMVLFFVFHVILASILLPRRISFLMAGLAVLLIACLAGLEYSGLVAHYHVPVAPSELYRDPSYLLATVATLTLTLAIVAYFATSIAGRLRERDAMLVESNVACRTRSQELADLNAQLQRMDAERTRFMVLVTHELRAPIATIYSALELVRGGYTSPQETADMLDRAQKRASELLDLIRDLLDLARIRDAAQAGPSVQAVAPLQVADVLREVVEFVGPDVERSNLSLQVEVAPDLAPARIPADQAKLVWTNLLSNAIKYNRPGGSVQVVLGQDAEHLLGSVSDTGIGIAPDDLPHLFDEFFRADNAKLVSAHGSGVGLAIVRRIIEAWGGHITVESELGKGTTFRFQLPRA